MGKERSDQTIQASQLVRDGKSRHITAIDCTEYALFIILQANGGDAHKAELNVSY
jgi:hypothetical protein